VTKVSTSPVSYSSLHNTETNQKNPNLIAWSMKAMLVNFTIIKTLYDVYTVFTGCCREEHRPRVFENRVLR